jgi:DNA-binding transcriptional regulator YiaG
LALDRRAARAADLPRLVAPLHKDKRQVDGGLLNGDFIRTVRGALNMTQAAFAVLFEVRTRTVERWETGRSRMSWKTEARLRAILRDHRMDPVVARRFAALGVETATTPDTLDTVLYPQREGSSRSQRSD